MCKLLSALSNMYVVPKVTLLQSLQLRPRGGSPVSANPLLDILLHGNQIIVPRFEDLIFGFVVA